MVRNSEMKKDIKVTPFELPYIFHPAATNNRISINIFAIFEEKAFANERGKIRLKLYV